MDKGTDKNSSDNLLLNPQVQQLKAEIDKLRTELSMLVLERDNLLFQECENIEMTYMLNIGYLEYKVYETECILLRLKRKMELMLSRKNRQEKIELSEIEAVLDKEFEEYQKKLNQQLELINAALKRSHFPSLTEEETLEMKKLYRVIVKALHPDLNQQLPQEKMQLFFNAVKAYQHGDLNELRIIAELISAPSFTEIPSNNELDALSALEEEKKRLHKLLENLRKDISQIKSQYPYTMKALVLNPDKMQARKAELQEHIKQLQEAINAYTTKIEDILRG